MYEIIKAVIDRGNYDLSGILRKINGYHVEDKLTDAERTELITLAREKADTMSGVDVMAMLRDHENRLRTLEDAGKTDTTEDETVPEYKSGTWYKAGDKVQFEGKVYVCTAPNGYIRAWSPADYPDYWELGE